MERRQFLATVTTLTATGLAGCGLPGDESPTGTESPTVAHSPTKGAGTATATETRPSLPEAVGLETLASGLEAPLDVAFAPDADRRYLADQVGRVHVHESGGLRDAPFLDLGDAVEVGREKGLLGIALHPNFAESRRLFVRYSAPSRPGTPSDYSHTFVLAEFEASADGRRAVPDSERPLLEIPEPQGNHNAGSVLFGPDGYLYVGVGDGGGGGDRGTGHVDDWYGAVAGGNGQDVTENLLGSVLRVDVDGEGDDRPYAVPPDNPLVGSEGLDEHYAWGFRNPWRMSFDGSDLYVGDVGQKKYEEVSLVRKGGNYGWNVLEGIHCYAAEECPSETPPDVRGGERLVDPVVEYPHSDAPVSGISIIGGHVYRGSAIDGLRGRYVFGDLRARGRLFVATPPEDGDGGGDGGDPGGTWSVEVLPLAGSGDRLRRLLSVGRDADGELYALGTGSDGGGFHRVVPAD